ncbi:hypothetical protein AAG906_035679 [Vitis piasezkii]
MPPTSAMLIAWLRPRRSRCLVLLLCSPILLPFLCATFPLLCAAELCIRLCRRRGGSPKRSSEGSGGRLRRCEEGGAGAEEEGEGEGEVGLLQRYLEDQIGLVGSVYECGDEEDLANHVDVVIFDSRTPLLTS